MTAGAARTAAGTGETGKIAAEKIPSGMAAAVRRKGIAIRKTTAAAGKKGAVTERTTVAARGKGIITKRRTATVRRKETAAAAKPGRAAMFPEWFLPRGRIILRSLAGITERTDRVWRLRLPAWQGEILNG